MIYYWIISYCIMFLAFFEINNKDQPGRNSKLITLYFFIMMTISMIVFAGVRGINSGIDDHQYIDFFNQASPGMGLFDFDQVKNDYRYESFFLYLAYLISSFTRNGYVFIFIIALISVSINAITYKKASNLILVSLSIYSAHLFINKDMNQIRFGLSSAFGMLSILFLLERRWFYAIAFLILSSQSHSTGYALLLFIPFIFFPRNKYIPIYMFLAAIPIGIIGGKSLILDHVSLFSNLAGRVNSYEGTEFDTVIPVFSLGNIKNIVFICLYVYFVFDGKKVSNENRIAYGLIVFYAIGASVRVTFSDFSIIGGRVGNLFLQVEPIVLSLIIYKIKNKYLGMLFLFGVVTYYLLYNTVLSVQSITGYDISPYFDLF